MKTWNSYRKGVFLGTVRAATKGAATRKIAKGMNSDTRGIRTTDARLDYSPVAPKRNPTKAQKREKSRKASVQRRVALSLAKYLKQVNPGMKTAGAKVQRLKGGVLKITPIKAIRGRK